MKHLQVIQRNNKPTIPAHYKNMFQKSSMTTAFSHAYRGKWRSWSTGKAGVDLGFFFFFKSFLIIDKATGKTREWIIIIIIIWKWQPVALFFFGLHQTIKLMYSTHTPKSISSWATAFLQTSAHKIDISLGSRYCLVTCSLVQLPRSFLPTLLEIFYQQKCCTPWNWKIKEKINKFKEKVEVVETGKRRREL